jgi:hypothetical protein
VTAPRRIPRFTPDRSRLNSIERERFAIIAKRTERACLNSA